jgi:hypothetical protein
MSVTGWFELAYWVVDIHWKRRKVASLGSKSVLRRTIVPCLRFSALHINRARDMPPL